MKNRDPYLKPFGNFEITDEFWKAVQDQLIDLSILKEQLINLCYIKVNEHTQGYDLLLTPKIDKLSLDEENSSEFITPFHLSFYGKKQLDSKKLGQFFTPSYISVFIAENSLRHYEEENKIDWKNSLPDLRVADIATGTGNLTMAFLYALYKRLKPFTDEKKEWLYSFFSTNLFAFDLDNFPLTIQKLRILFFSSYFLPEFDLPDLEKTVIRGNSLIDNPDLYKKTGRYFFKSIKLFQDYNEEFDIIISNPPYMSSGLRKAQKYEPEFKNYLRKRYETAEYKLSLYPIFIERSIELLAQGGILGIITPDSHLLGRYYSKLRSYILDNSDILDISLLGFEPFSGVTLGRTTITFLRKNKLASKLRHPKYFTARWIPSLSKFLKKEWDDFENYQTEFYNNQYNRFILYFDLPSKNAVNQWREIATKQLKDLVTMHTGVRAKIGQNNIISKKPQNENWRRGIVSSSQVLPFLIKYDRDWINITPNLLWSGGFDKNIVERPKIILRQTGYKIIAAVDDQGYYHLNNCHTISPINPDTNLCALAVQLNSSEFNQVYNILSMEKGRALAQVDMDFLLERHVIKTTKEEEEKLNQFYFKLQKKQMQSQTIQGYKLLSLI